MPLPKTVWLVYDIQVVKLLSSLLFGKVLKFCRLKTAIVFAKINRNFWGSILRFRDDDL